MGARFASHLSLVTAFLACTQQSSQAQDKTLLQYVKPIIGTEKMGHTYPGATVPFGMVQLSPETDTIPYERGSRPRMYINTSQSTRIQTRL